MFYVEIIQGIGKPPIRVEASQVVIRMPNGTPVSVAALYGGPTSVLVSHCEDPNFNANLNKLGINETVVVSTIKV
jgi:hypothetical protein